MVEEEGEKKKHPPSLINKSNTVTAHNYDREIPIIDDIYVTYLLNSLKRAYDPI